MVNFNRMDAIRVSLNMSQKNFQLLMVIGNPTWYGYKNGVTELPEVIRKKVYCLIATMKHRQTNARLRALIAKGREGINKVKELLNEKIAINIPMSMLQVTPFRIGLLNIFYDLSMYKKNIYQSSVAKKVNSMIDDYFMVEKPNTNLYIGGIEDVFDICDTSKGVNTSEFEADELGIDRL